MFNARAQMEQDFKSAVETMKGIIPIIKKIKEQEDIISGLEKEQREMSEFINISKKFLKLTISTDKLDKDIAGMRGTLARSEDRLKKIQEELELLICEEKAYLDYAERIAKHYYSDKKVITINDIDETQDEKALMAFFVIVKDIEKPDIYTEPDFQFPSMEMDKAMIIDIGMRGWNALYEYIKNEK